MRYKEYNVNAFLEKSIDLFWAKGFNGCSINDLVEGTRVNRFSIYHEFEDKEDILIKSLKLYKSRYSEGHIELLEKVGDLKQVLMDFYLSFLHPSSRVEGCYFIHIGTELADSNSDVKAALSDYLEDIKDAIKGLLKRSNFDSDRIDLVADHLLGLYCTAMSFCLVQGEAERAKYIRNGLSIITNEYA